MTVLVTGAAGFIGSHTCDHLLAGNHTVIGVDNFRTGRRENLVSAQGRRDFRFEEIDITEAAKFHALVAEVRPTAIIHLAALVSVPESIADPTENFRLNVEATQVVAEAARRLHVPRIVFASSAAVYGHVREQPILESCEGRPLSPYGGAKLASEALLLASGAAFGFTVVCLRYFNVFGPRQDPRSPYSGVISIFCDRLRAGQAITIFGNGEQTRDFISVRDVARANALGATVPDLAGGVMNVCTGKGTSLNQLTALLQRLFGQAPATTYAEAREGDIRHSIGSAVRAQTALNFSATVTLETGLAQLIQSH